jgi:formiminotetrahydrofolate cyclodeaminase
MREAETIASSGAPSAVSDVAVAVELLKTAARGAATNVDTNLASVKDTEYVSRVSQERRDLEQAMENLL